MDRRTYGERGLVEEEEIYEVENSKCEAMINKKRGLGEEMKRENYSAIY